LTSFFSEVLRLKASVWSFRLVLEDAVVPAGGKKYFFPKSSTLWVPVPLVHRDEDVYKNALQFEPDRFLKVDKETDENGHVHEKLIKKVLFSKNGKQTRMSHLPFGGGKSMVIPCRGVANYQCPGRNFARAIVITYASTFLHFFDITLLGELPKIRPADRFGLGVELPIESLPAKVKIRKL
jgi:cytochrome P450